MYIYNISIFCQLSQGISTEDCQALNDTEKTVEARASVLCDVLIRVQDNLELEHGEEASQEVEMSPPKKVPRESSSKCGGTCTSSKKTTLKTVNTIIL